MNAAQVIADKITKCDVREFGSLYTEIRQERWTLKDKWLEASLSVEAQKNGLLSDHFVNFTDLFDAIIVKAIVDRLAVIEQNSFFIPFFALLQLIFSENERVLAFYILKPVIRDKAVLVAMLNHCPGLRKCIPMLMDSIHECIYEDLQYFALFTSLLASKYPSQATLELCQFILNELRVVGWDEIITESVARIKFTFPFIEDAANQSPPMRKPIFANKMMLN